MQKTKTRRILEFFEMIISDFLKIVFNPKNEKLKLLDNFSPNSEIFRIFRKTVQWVI